MGIGVVGWALGNVYYTVVLWDQDPIPVPSPSDVLWIVYYPIVYVAVAMLLRARIARFHASLWVDGALAALAVGALSAAVVFQSVLASTGGDPSRSRPTSPIRSATSSSSGWSPAASRSPAGSPAARGARWRAASSSSASATASTLGQRVGTWPTGSIFEAGWPAATLLLAWAAWCRRSTCARACSRAGACSSCRRCSRCSASSLLISDHFARLNLLAVALAWASLLAVIGRFGMTFFANLHDARATRARRR